MIFRFKDELYRKGIFIFLIFIILLVSLSNCEKEKAQPREYPRVNTFAVTNITENGATFKGEIYSAGTEPITEHGFVWNAFYNPMYGSSNQVIIGPAKGAGEFSADVLTTLAEGSEYQVKAFAKTDEYIVYGPKVTFTSMGSGAPKVTGFEPSSGRWGDTITIKGDNFSYIPNYNIVLFNYIQCTVVRSTDTTLLVVLSNLLKEEKYKISVGILGNFSAYTDNEFTLVLPVISVMNPVHGEWGDTLVVTGERLGTEKNNFLVTVGGYNAQIIAKRNDSLMFTVPYDLATETNEVKIKINNLVLNVAEIFTLSPPYISGISPKEGTWGTIVTLRGKFHPSLARNKITIGGAQQDIISNNKDSIKIRVTPAVSNHDNPVRVISTPFNILASDTFILYGPYIESITPMAAPSAADIVITGKYLQWYTYSSNFTQVYFGAEPAWMASVSNTKIICKVPNGVPNGPTKVTVKVNAQSTIYDNDFMMENPVVTNVYPLTGYYGDEITVEGEHFVFSQHSTFVYFRNYNDTYIMESAEIVSLTDNKIVVRVPGGIDTVPKIICVQCGWGVTPSQQQFVLTPP